MRRKCTALNKLLKEVRRQYPRANYYLDGTGNLNLMSDDAFDQQGRAQYDRILAAAHIEAGSGDW